MVRAVAQVVAVAMFPSIKAIVLVADAWRNLSVPALFQRSPAAGAEGSAEPADSRMLAVDVPEATVVNLPVIVPPA